MLKKVLFIFPNTANRSYISMSIPILAGIAKSQGWDISYFDTSNYKKRSDSIQDKEMMGCFKHRPNEYQPNVKSFEDITIDLQNKIDTFHPDIIAITAMTCDYEFLMEFWPNINTCNAVIVIGGFHATVLPHDVLNTKLFDVVCFGQGEETFAELLDCVANNKTLDNIKGIFYRRSNGEIVKTENRILLDSEELWKTNRDYSFFDSSYFSFPFDGGNIKMSHIEGGRGCPYHCLHGNTIINTTDGLFKIKDLVGKTPKVLTRNPKTYDVEYAQTSSVFKTQTDAKLVRVLFDNSDYIDCTPDHKFITFKNGNQSSETTEKEVEAKDLKAGESVRAIHCDETKQGYIDIVWGRRKRKRYHRLVMESIIGRELTNKEHIHHIDHNKKNNTASNLILTNIHDHIATYHPEVSIRMKENNPIKYLSQEQRIQNGKNNKGIKRSLETRMKLRESKLGSKNPRYTGGKRPCPSRILELEVNHKIVSVTELIEKSDVYCMEVPNYGWFYANNVLVHNCSYCGNDVIKRAYRGLGKYLQTRSVDSLMSNVEDLMKNHDVEMFNFTDECFSVKTKEWRKEFNIRWKEIKKPFFLQSRAEYITEEFIETILESDAPFIQIGMGVESGSQRILKEVCDRKIDTEETIRAFDLIHKYPKIRSNSYYMLGFPTETRKEVFETIKLCRRLNANVNSVAIYQPFPGQRMRDFCIEKGYITGREPMQTFTGGSILKQPQITQDEVYNLWRCFMLYAKLPEEMHLNIFECETRPDDTQELYDSLVKKRWEICS